LQLQEKSRYSGFNYLSNKLHSRNDSDFFSNFRERFQISTYGLLAGNDHLELNIRKFIEKIRLSVLRKIEKDTLTSEFLELAIEVLDGLKPPNVYSEIFPKDQWLLPDHQSE